ncbi:MAG: 3-oxoacyl-[acyl-carrier protein] reductase [Bacteroidota bacterium]|nr:3-oxoacyl-[acyl-carrier protein] reductase [Bacteroidota bacterium]
MKNILVTGGSRGIGKAVCVRLEQPDSHIILNYNSSITKAEETLAQINEAGGSCELLKFDVSNKEETESVVNAWLDNHDGEYIHTLINNAGIRRDNLMWWMSDAEWFDVINTNLNGFFYITRLLLKGMMSNKSGRIINIVSLSGIKGLPGQVNYSAAKAAVIGATKALAQEVGKKKVTVNAVAPGFIKTDMIEGLNEKELKGMIPLNRFGEAVEVAELVAFLASDKSEYITGEVISINGGLYT